MKNLYGIKGLQIACFAYTDSANDFLRKHDGYIIDIQSSETDITIIYINTEVE